MHIQTILSLYKAATVIVDTGVTALPSANIFVVYKIYELNKELLHRTKDYMHKKDLLVEEDSIRDLSEEDFHTLYEVIHDGEASELRTSNIDILEEISSSWWPCDVCSASYPMDEPCEFH